MRNGYTWCDKRKLDPGQFSTLISSMGQWYSIRIQFFRPESGIDHSVTIYDSLKIIPMSIKDIPHTFDVCLEKLDLDYEGDREIGHELTEEEKAYIHNDTMILARALRFMKENGMSKLTTASNAMEKFKKQTGKEEFKKLFPELTAIEDRDIRLSYKGGFTYLNPKYKNVPIGDGQVYDVNSMYPWAMKYCALPWGKPIYFAGKYKEHAAYPLYVQSLSCEFKLKPGHIPSIQIKNNFRYNDTEYLTSSDGVTVLCLTSVDLKLFFDNYDVDVFEWYGGYMFHSKTGIFADYIDHWYSVKDTSKAEGNLGMAKIAKLMLNSLYGKFGSNPKGRSKIPYLDEEKDKVCFRYSQEEDRRAYYLPIATFITSYARDKIIRAAEKMGDRFIYADTDSLHVKGLEPGEIDIDEHRLGAFKVEEVFTSAKFIRQKTYFEMVNGKLDVKCAGMPKAVKATVTPENFQEGAEFNGKLMPRIVPGGVILRETTFKIKKINNNVNPTTELTQ